MNTRQPQIEQLAINPLTSYVPMGSFIIKSKVGANAEEYIVSPGVQTCVVAVLDSIHGVAVAHFDTPFVVEQTIKEMLSELKKMGQGAITARLYGGNFGNPITGSAIISEETTGVLKENGIPVTHTDYHFTNSYLMAALAILWSLSPYGLDSKFQAFILVLIAYCYPALLKILLPENLRPDYVGDNRNVYVNVQSGNVHCKVANLKSSMEILKRFVALNPEEFRAIFQRSQFDPQNPTQASNLRMFRLNGNKGRIEPGSAVTLARK